MCIYALPDVKRCLNSVLGNLLPDHKIIIINDFSDKETTHYLRNIKEENKDKITLIENQENIGYVKSANLGLKAQLLIFE